MRWMLKRAIGGQLLGEANLPDGYNPNGGIITCRDTRFRVVESEAFYADRPGGVPGGVKSFDGILWVEIPTKPRT